ncbi:aldehyde dehydrogenase family protein [Brachybacterium sp. J144]|uniref:aldehyde dehydrogenase family protein n=1 Tax=Brachybacterium sp. J144 TaxID=3116487 RepID=UPI002E783F0F|nr:aldehyde dehydrogenase family protein [Brachybacterium sp. J144]MEE1650111.1 aldehyde dehydrogenase family protein [Brachybacterium sp. J144]
MSAPDTDQSPAADHDAPPDAVPAVVAERILADVAALRESAALGHARSLGARLAQLEALRRGIRAEEGRIARALAQDLGKSATEVLITEIGPTLSEIDHALRHLRSWARPGPFPMGALLAPAGGRLHPEPLGTVLIIAPWNYPVNLTLGPLVAAIGAGNTVLMKPSELAPHTSAALARLVREHLDPAWVRVVEGGVPETTLLLEQRWDLIMYTGNGRVGRVVARAAAEHLTPTLLELGGKSPVFVDDDVDLRVVARRIAWGKFTNAGQTCIAPDYVMASPETLTALVPHLARAVRALYGKDPSRSRDYGRIVNERHLDRLLGLIDAEKVVLGGTAGADRGSRFLPPTILAGADWSDPVMQEEIFGPVLPLLAVDGPAEAVARIAAGDKPLTAYVFTGSTEVEEMFVEGTSSGSLAVNVVLAHISSPDLPFGGVGESGMGAYHGRAGFEAFSHLKPVARKPLRPDTLRLVQPPYGRAARALLRRVMV